jgi:hypothetical protein
MDTKGFSLNDSFLTSETIDNSTLSNYNIMENDIRSSNPRLLEIFLLDQTASTHRKPHNIIWANDNY